MTDNDGLATALSGDAHVSTERVAGASAAGNLRVVIPHDIDVHHPPRVIRQCSPNSSYLSALNSYPKTGLYR